MTGGVLFSEIRSSTGSTRRMATDFERDRRDRRMCTERLLARVRASSRRSSPHQHIPILRLASMQTIPEFGSRDTVESGRARSQTVTEVGLETIRLLEIERARPPRRAVRRWRLGGIVSRRCDAEQHLPACFGLARNNPLVFESEERHLPNCARDHEIAFAAAPRSSKPRFTCKGLFPRKERIGASYRQFLIRNVWGTASRKIFTAGRPPPRPNMPANEGRRTRQATRRAGVRYRDCPHAVRMTLPA